MSEKAKKVKARRGKRKAAGPRSDAGKKASKRPAPTPNLRAGARAKRPVLLGVTPDVKTQRVFQIVRDMNSNRWSPERAHELATEWGLAPSTVTVMACEASRILTITVEDRKAMVRELELRLMEISKLDGPDRVQAIRTQFEHLGELRKRVELTGRDGEAIPIGVTAKLIVLPALNSSEQESQGKEPT